MSREAEVCLFLYEHDERVVAGLLESARSSLIPDVYLHSLLEYTIALIEASYLWYKNELYSMPIIDLLLDKQWELPCRPPTHVPTVYSSSSKSLYSRR